MCFFIDFFKLQPFRQFWARNMFFTSKWDRISLEMQWSMFQHLNDDRISHMTAVSVYLGIYLYLHTCRPWVSSPFHPKLWIFVQKYVFFEKILLKDISFRDGSNYIYVNFKGTSVTNVSWCMNLELIRK